MGRRRVNDLVVVATTIMMAIVVLVLFHRGGAGVGGGDQGSYLAYAENLVHHGVFSPVPAYPFPSSPYPAATARFPASVYRLPGYPGFVALFALIFAKPLVWLRIGQFALLAIAGIAVGRLAELLGVARAALPAALITVTYLPLLWLSGMVVTDMLATTLAVLLVVGFCILRESGPRIWLCAVVGATAAALTYVRPEFSVFGALLAVLLLAPFRRRRGWARALAASGAVLAVMLVALVPWAVRNASTAQAFVPLGANSGDDVYASALQYAGAVSDRFTPVDFTRWASMENRATGSPPPHIKLAAWEVRRNTLLQHAAWRLFRSLSLTRVLSALPSRFAYLWSTADFYPPGPAGRIAHRVGQAQYALYVLLLVVGLAISVARRIWRLWPLLLLPVYLTLLHLVSHVQANYTVTARPFLFVFVAIGALFVYDRASNLRIYTRLRPKRV